MTLTTIDFADRADAYDDAESHGFANDAVTVLPAGNGRFQWHVREVAELRAEVAMGLRDADSVYDSDTDGLNDADADSDADSLDMLPDVAVVALTEVDLADVAETVSADPGATVAPMEVVTVAEVVEQAETVAEPVDVAAVASVDASMVADVVADVAADVVVSVPQITMGNCILQIHGELPAAAAEQLARVIADSQGAVVIVRDAASFAMVATMVPMGASGGRKVRAAVRGQTSVSAPSVRAESMIDRIRRGVWDDAEVVSSNKTILPLKHKIEAARDSLDLDALHALNGFKSISTYYNQARAYLEHAIAYVTAELVELERTRAAEREALDREFGFGAIYA